MALRHHHGLHQHGHAYYFDDPFKVIGQHRQAHFSTNPVKGLSQEMRIAHPGFQGAKGGARRSADAPAWPRVICPAVSAWLLAPLHVSSGPLSVVCPVCTSL